MIARLPGLSQLFCGIRRPLFAGFLALATGTASAAGAELKVVTRTEVAPVLSSLAPQIEHLTGSKVVVDIAGPGAYGRRLGEAFDVAIVDEWTAETLIKQGKVAADGLTCLAWTGLGMAARTGVKKPDIGTVDGLRRTLLAARSIAFTGDDHSGSEFRALLWQLGIAEQVETKLVDSGNHHPLKVVAHGSADLAIAWQSEIIAAPGIQAADILPAEVQHYMAFFAASSSEPAEPAAAKRLNCLSHLP